MDTDPTQNTPDPVTPEPRPRPDVQQWPAPQAPGAARTAAGTIPERPQGTFRKGFGWGAGVGTGLALVGTVIGAVSTIGLIIGTLAMAATTLGSATTNDVIWGSGEGRLRAIRIEGAIMAEGSGGGLLSAGTYGYDIAAELDALGKDDASGVVLLVNTPGGSISGSKAIADAIVRYQERTDQVVLVHVSEMSASGGVYATAPADEIIADHGTLVGSIGVIMGPFTHYDGVTATGSTLLEQGVTTTGGITSDYFTAGTGKDFGNPFRAVTEEERAHYQAGIDAEYAKFVSHVSKYRDIPEAEIRGELGALIFDPDAASANGLIDAVMGRDEFFRHAAEAAGLDPDDTAVEAAMGEVGWTSLLGIRQARPVGMAPAVEQGPGITPVLNAGICSGTRPLVFAGDLATVCG